VIYQRLSRSIRTRALPLMLGSCLAVSGAVALVQASPVLAEGAPEEPITEACSGPISGGDVLRLCGTLNPHARAKAGYHFAYNTGPSCTGGGQTPAVAEVEGEDVEARGELTGLRSGTEYSYCLVAANEVGETYGQPLTYTTEPGPPEIPITGCSEGGVQPASSLMLCGILNPTASASTNYYFALNAGPSCEGGIRTSLGHIDGEHVEVRYEPTGLVPNTLYSYCLVAQNEYGTSPGGTGTIEMGPVPATIIDESASSITPTAAMLQADINPMNDEAIPSFRYATTRELAGAVTVSGARIAAGLHAEPVSVAISGLEPSTTYYFQAVTTNGSSETSEGPVEFFTTPSTIEPQGPPTIAGSSGIGLPPVLGTSPDGPSPRPAVVPPPHLTNAEKLAKAVSACKKKPKKQQARCRRAAHEKYAIKRKATKK
jgi:hypothetical protein